MQLALLHVFILFLSIDFVEKDITKEVRKIIDQLDVMDRTYFAKDRQKQLKAKITDAIALLDQKPIDLGKFGRQFFAIMF